MGLSNSIEQFIIELLKNEEEGDWLELKRNEIADIFKCVPSQINYVMATRFNPQKGYIVESRRGGGGYIRIRRIYSDGNEVLKVINSIGESIGAAEAAEAVEYLRCNDKLTPREEKLIFGAIDDRSIILPEQNKDIVRAGILKNMLKALL